MSGLYVCENAGKCKKHPCAKSRLFDNSCTPHAMDENCKIGCVRDGGIKGSRCIPYVEHVSPKAPVSDPDVAMAREYAEKCGGKHGNDCSKLLLRLADKLEGKTK